MKRTRWLLVTALAGGVLLAWTAGPAQAALDKCQAAIEKEGIKLESKLIKALQKCKDFYRKQLLTNQAKGTPGDKMTGAGGVGEKCAKQLVKTWKFPDPDGKSAMAKALTGLLKLVPTPTGTATPGKEKCTDADLIALGHLPVDTFGDKFARLILIMKQKGAYYQQIWLVRDVMNIFQRLAGGHPTINNDEEADCDAFAGGLCAQLTKPPCAAHACALGSGSKVCVDTTNPALDLSLTLQGFSILQFCDVPSVLPNDFAVIGSPSKGLLPVPLTGVGTACVLAVGAEGYVTKSGSTNPKVDYTICQDHDINTGVGATGNDCLDVFVPSGTCQPSQPDPMTAHSGAQNGGACIELSTAAAGPGDAFVMNTTQITVVLDSPTDQKGLDGQACTTDDTAPPGIPGTIPLTTGTGNALVVQPNNGAVGTTLGTTTQCIGAGFGGSATGQAFGNLLDVERSILSGGRLSGAFPALHALLSTPPTNPGLDSVTAFNLECQ